MFNRRRKSYRFGTTLFVDDESIQFFGVSYPFNSKEWDHFNNV